MIEISGAKDIRQKYTSSLELLSECQKLFNRLSKSRVNQLLSSLNQIDPHSNNTYSLVAHITSQATIKTIELLEAPDAQEKVATDLKSPLPIAGLELIKLANSTPDFLDLLQHIVQLRISMVNVHNSLHDKSPKRHIPSDAPAHTAVHALGEITHTLMFLPQLRELQKRQKLLVEPLEVNAGSLIWRPARKISFDSGITPFNLLQTPKEF